MWQKSIMELYRHPKEYFTNNWFLDSEEDFLDNRHALRSYAFLPPPILKELIHSYELKNIVRALEPLQDAIRKCGEDNSHEIQAILLRSDQSLRRRIKVIQLLFKRYLEYKERQPDSEVTSTNDM